MADPRYAQPANLAPIQNIDHAKGSKINNSVNLKGGNCFLMGDMQSGQPQTIGAADSNNITPAEGAIIYASKSNAGLLKNANGTLCTKDNNPQSYNLDENDNCLFETSGNFRDVSSSTSLNIQKNIGYVCYEFDGGKGPQPPVQGVYLNPPLDNGKKIIDPALGDPVNQSWPSPAPAATLMGARSGLNEDYKGMAIPTYVEGRDVYFYDKSTNKKVQVTDIKGRTCTRGTLASVDTSGVSEYQVPLVQGSRSPDGSSSDFSVNYGYTDIQEGSGTYCTGLCVAPSGVQGGNTYNEVQLQNIKNCTSSNACETTLCIDKKLPTDSPTDEFGYLKDPSPIMRDPADPIYSLDKDTCLNLSGNTLWCEEGVGNCLLFLIKGLS